MSAGPERSLLAARLATAAFAVSLLLGVLLPIYTDEIGWRFQARAALDGGVDRFVAEQCGVNTLARPPFFLLPLRYLTAWVNLWLADPIFVRLTGVLCAGAWVAMLLATIRALARDAAERVTFTLLAFGLLGLGVLPLLLVMNRPEQPILLACTAALLIAVTARPGEGDGHNRPGAAMRSGLVVLAGALALGFHLKAVVVMLIFLISAALSSRGPAGRPARIAGVVALLALTATALPYWVGRFQCPDDPVVAALLARQSIASTLFGASSFLEQLGPAFRSANPATYVDLILPRPHYTADWLPAGLVDPFSKAFWAWPIRAAWLGSLLLAALLLIRSLMRRASGPDGVAALLPATIAAATIGWGALQLAKNDYEAALALPLLLLCVLLALRGAALGPKALRRVRIWSAAVALIALGSQAVVLGAYAGPLLKAARSPGYLEGQDFSFSAFGYGKLKPRIEAAGRACGIEPGRKPRGLLVDDLTYFAYMDSWRPLHRTGVLEPYQGRIGDPLAYLHRRGSAGLVVGCGYLSPELRARARRTGEFCCIATNAPR